MSWRVVRNGITSQLFSNPMELTAWYSCQFGVVALLGLTSSRFRSQYKAEWKRFPLSLIRSSLSRFVFLLQESLCFSKFHSIRKEGICKISKLIPRGADPSTVPTPTYFCHLFLLGTGFERGGSSRTGFWRDWGGILGAWNEATLCHIPSAALSSRPVSTYIHVAGSLSFPWGNSTTWKIIANGISAGLDSKSTLVATAGGDLQVHMLREETGIADYPDTIILKRALERINYFAGNVKTLDSEDKIWFHIKIRETENSEN